MRQDKTIITQPEVHTTMELRSGMKLEGVDYAKRYEEFRRNYMVAIKLMHCEYNDEKCMSKKEVFVRRTIRYMSKNRNDMYRFIDITHKMKPFIDDLYNKAFVMYKQRKIEDWSLMHEDVNNLSKFEWNMSMIMKEHHEAMVKDIEHFMYDIYHRLLRHHNHVIHKKKNMIQSCRHNMCPHVVEHIFSYIT